MKSNFHFPLKWKECSTATGETYNGFILTVKNAEIVPFSKDFAKTHYSHLGEKFWTCRNFQFAAQMYAKLPKVQ